MMDFIFYVCAPFCFYLISAMRAILEHGFIYVDTHIGISLQNPVFRHSSKNPKIPIPKTLSKKASLCMLS